MRCRNRIVVGQNRIAQWILRRAQQVPVYGLCALRHTSEVREGWALLQNSGSPSEGRAGSTRIQAEVGPGHSSGDRPGNGDGAKGLGYSVHVHYNNFVLTARKGQRRINK